MVGPKNSTTRLSLSVSKMGKGTVWRKKRHEKEEEGLITLRMVQLVSQGNFL